MASFISRQPVMATTIALTENEATLKQLLLDVSVYIGTLEGYKKPELRFTGGWVRDKLIGVTSHDIDIGIDTMTGFDFGNLMRQYLAQPETKDKYKQDILGSLAKIAANPEKSKHLETVTTKILGLEVDLVNLRKETYTEKSRTPTMEFGTPEEDALRRDATVNALFYNLNTSEVEDLTTRGLHDMNAKVIKTPLAPLQTFNDDPLRVLRCTRFASRLEYEIAEEDRKAMRKDEIKEAFKKKISRERVGVEIEKMMKGPHPRRSLSLIEDLGWYNDIFTDPTDHECKAVDIQHWHLAYNQLYQLTERMTNSQRNIAETLLRQSDDTFFAWMLVCFVPWAREQSNPPNKQATKKIPSPGGIAARKGLSANNKISEVVDNAITHMSDIVAMKRAVIEQEQRLHLSPDSTQKSMMRMAQGQAIRRWGSHWRSSVMFALLVEISEAIDVPGTPKLNQEILDDYVMWLLKLRDLDLLDVDQLKPIVNGKQISEALGKPKLGPWMKKAMDIAMEWQLRNPQVTDPEGGIAEVKERRKELGMPYS